MRKLTKWALAAALVGVTGVAFADKAETKGGLKIKSDDGKFDMGIGGRIHFDANVINRDKGSTFGSGAAGGEGSGLFFRRVFLTLVGDLYGWGYHIDEDINSGSSPAAGFNDVWLTKSWGPSAIYIGQHKPWRSFDEMMSNNEIVTIERNVTSANGVFGGQDFMEGLFYRYAAHGLFVGLSGYSLAKAGQSATQGAGGNFRVAFAPINSAGALLHVGVTYSKDHADKVGGFGGFSSGYSTYYGKQGKGQNVYSLAGDATADTWSAEAAGIMGPVYLNGEYVSRKFKQNGAADQKVDAFSVTASYYVTGESKIYKAGDAAIGSATPKNDFGAVELVAQYNTIKNKDNFGACGGTATACKVGNLTFGVNYYVASNVRFMLNYIIGSNDHGAAGKDKPKTLAARAQIAF